MLNLHLKLVIIDVGGVDIIGLFFTMTQSARQNTFFYMAGLYCLFQIPIMISLCSNNPLENA